MIGPFEHETRASRVVFGPGSHASLPAETARLGASRVLVLSTPGHAALGNATTDMLGTSAMLFDSAQMHVPMEIALKAIDAARSFRAEACVAVGGGSTIGLAKAIALETGLPIIAVPTTYAGSEMTPLYGITQSGEKRTGRDWVVMPKTVIYDPELTLALPMSITVCSALNAIAHAAEALYAQDASPLHKITAEGGIAILAKVLPALLQDGKSLEWRGEAQVGTWLCGSVLGQVQMGLHHKVCHVLGGSFNLPHAETHAVVLPHALAYNARAVPDALAAISRAFGGGEVFGRLEEFYRTLGAPTSLKAIGMPEEGLDRAAGLICAAPYPNPVAFERQAIRDMLQNAFSGQFVR